jgi:hypothetical protein
MAYEIIVICTGFFPAYKLVGRWLRHIPYRDKDIVLLGIWILFAVLSGIFISVFFFRKGVKNLQEMS